MLCAYAPLPWAYFSAAPLFPCCAQFLLGGVLIVNLILAIIYVNYQKQQEGACALAECYKLPGFPVRVRLPHGNIARAVFVCVCIHVCVLVFYVCVCV